MALPTYREVLSDPEFQSADVTRQRQINDAYWKAYSTEAPGDDWGAEMKSTSSKALEIKSQMTDASPLEQRNLGYQRETLNTKLRLGIGLKEGAFKTTKEFTDATAAENFRLAGERSKLGKTASLLDPEVDKQMQPAWEALGKSALDEGVFGEQTLSPTAKPGRYDELRTELSNTFHLAPEEVDDVVKHRMGLQADPVSRDAFGQVHIKPEILSQPAADIQKAIESSKLPQSVKDREIPLIPDKIAGFRSGFVDNVVKNHPEFATQIGIDPEKPAEENFKLLTDNLRTSATAQFGGGALAPALGTAATVGKVFAPTTTGSGLTIPGAYQQSQEDVAQIENQSKVEQSRNDLSYALNKEATTLLGTNAATIGAGVESIGESIVLGAATGGLAPEFALAKLAGSGKAGKYVVQGINSMSKVAPTAGVFGARQGVQTYEQALKAGMSEEDALKFGVQSGAIETFTTMLFSGLHLGGAEDIATGAARQRVASEIVSKIRSVPWAATKGVFKSVSGELLEENTITALDSVLTQAKLNPNMTESDIKQALYDTTVATLVAGGVFAAKAGFDEAQQTKVNNAATATQTTEQLEEQADAIRFQTLAEENLPEAQAEGKDVTPSSPERVAALLSRKAEILADLKLVAPSSPSQEKLLDELAEIEDEQDNFQEPSASADLGAGAATATKPGGDVVIESNDFTESVTPTPETPLPPTEVATQRESTKMMVGGELVNTPSEPATAPAEVTPTPQTDEVPQDERRQGDGGREAPVSSEEARQGRQGQEDQAVLAPEASPAKAGEAVVAWEDPKLERPVRDALAHDIRESERKRAINTFFEENSVERRSEYEDFYEKINDESDKVIGRWEAFKQWRAQTGKVVDVVSENVTPLIAAPSPTVDPQNLTAVTDAVLGALGITREEAAGITGETLSQEAEPANTPNAQVTFSGLASALITYYKNANGSSAVHEPIHIARRFLLNRNIPSEKRTGITDEMIDAANEFVGATDSNWTVAQEEKFARAFERYLWEGVETGVPKVDSLFEQIKKFMRDVYKNIKGSSLDVELTPEIRQLFDKLITRGETLKEQGKAPTPIKIEVKVKKPTVPQVSISTTSPEQLGVRKALLKSQAEAFGVAAPNRRVSMSDQEAIEIAEARLRNPEARTGSDLVEYLLSHPEQTTDKVGHALLAHEMVKRANRVDQLRERAKKEGGSSGDRAVAASALRDAYDKLEEILDVIRFQGSKAGLALQAMKLVTNRKFELEQMLGDAQVWANDGSTVRVSLTDEQRQLVQDMHDKIKALQEENEELSKELDAAVKKAEEDAILAAQARAVKQVKAVKADERVRIIREKLPVSDALSRLKARGNLFGGGALSQEGEKTSVNWDARGMGGTSNQVDIDYFGHVRSMSHKVFRSIVKPGNWDTNTIPVAEQKMRSGEAVAPPFIEADWDDKKKVLKAYGHEGRSRSDAANRVAPGQDIPVHIFIRGIRARNLTEEMRDAPIVPENGGKPVRTKTQTKKLYRGGENKKGLNYYTSSKDYAEKSYGGTIQETEVDESKIIDLTGEGNSPINSGYFIRLMREKGLDVKSIMTDEERGGIWKQVWNMDHTKLKGLLERAGLEGIKWIEYGPPQGEFGAQQKAEAYLLTGRDTDSLSQSPEGLSPEVLDDLATVGASFILDGSNTEAKFADALAKEFGEDSRPFASEIFERSKAKLDKTRKNAKVKKTPSELKAEIDPTKPISNKMVFNMVRGYLEEGVPKEEVLALVHKDLQETWPKVTFDEVSDAYTGYGKAKYPEQEELSRQIRELRNIERIKRQIRVVESGQAPKKTGQQRDPATDRVRELEQELKAAFKRAGIKDTSSNQLKSALGAIKTRFRNQLRDFRRALDTHTKLPENKRGVEYDEEAKRLKAAVTKLRDEYTKTFEDKNLTEKQRIQRAVTTLDRLIVEEQDMLAKGILSKPRQPKAIFTDPEVKAREATLKKLRDARRSALAALNPRKSKATLALEAAIRENRKGLERDRQVVGTGILPTPAKRTPSFTPTQELTDILNERQTLKDIIKRLRGQKSRLDRLSKADALREQRAVEAAEKSLAKIEQRIADIAAGKPAPAKNAPRPATLAVTLARSLRDSRRDTLRKLEAALKVTKSADELREDRLVKAAETRIKKYQLRLKNKDFAKAVKLPELITKRLADVRFREAQAKADWLKARADFMLEGAPWYRKASRITRGLLQLRKLISLGGDIGAILRQMGVVTYRNVFHPRVMATVFGKAFKAGFTLDEKNEYEIYEAISTAPEAVMYKQMNMIFHNPFDEAYGNKEDIPDPEFLNVIRNAPAWKSLFIGKGLAQVLGAAERFQRAYLNQGRYEFMKALVDSMGGMEHLTPEQMALIGNAVMMGTGRWSGKRNNDFENKLEQAIPLLNSTFFISARYSLSRLAIAIGQPVWSSKGGAITDNLALRRKIALEIYGKSVIGRAIFMTLLKMGYDAATGDDDEEERWRGVFNPRDKANFMKVKVGKTRIDMSSGIGPYLSELKLLFDAAGGNAVKVDRTTGEVKKMKSREVADELINFQLNRSNINAAWVARTFFTKEYYGGKPATVENAIKELILPIMVNDTRKLYEEHGVEGLAIWAQMMLGDGVQPPSDFKKKTTSSSLKFKY